jgi:hypothetical protein
LDNPAGVENPAPSRLEIGDTADLEICATKNFVLRPLVHASCFRAVFGLDAGTNIA